MWTGALIFQSILVCSVHVYAYFLAKEGELFDQQLSHLRASLTRQPAGGDCWGSRSSDLFAGSDATKQPVNQAGESGARVPEDAHPSHTQLVLPQSTSYSQSFRSQQIKVGQIILQFL